MPTVVAIILAIGVMVFLIQLGEALTKRSSAKARGISDKELDELRKQMDSLRRELTELRETAGEHALSVDRSLSMLSDRLGRLERGGATEQLQQRLGGEA